MIVTMTDDAPYQKRLENVTSEILKNWGEMHYSSQLLLTLFATVCSIIPLIS